MTLRFPLLLLILATSPLLLADQADLNATVTVSDSTINTGEWFTVTGTVKNKGPDDARNVIAFIAFGYQPLYSDVTASSNWTCTGVTCTTPILKSGEEATVTARFLSYNDLNSPTMSGTFNVVQSVQEPDYSNNHPTFTITLVESSAHAGLSVGLMPERNPALINEPTSVFVNAHNGGPDPAPNVLVQLFLPDTTDFQLTGLAGDGWQCDLAQLRCSRSVLAANETATIALRFFGLRNSTISIDAQIAAEHITDRFSPDNFTSTLQSVGNPADYERVLVPITVGETPGAFGSRWTSELWMKIDSDTAVPIEPVMQCAFWPDCTPPSIPLRKTFLVAYPIFNVTQRAEPEGSLLYFKRGDAARVTFNLRIRDLSRAAQTWGTEIPVIRESGLRSGTTSLINVPLETTFRQMLRIYDADARQGAAVVVRFYDNSGGTPLLVMPVPFLVRESNNFVTTALLPYRPGSIQVDLGSLPELRGHDRVTVEIEPLTPSLRYWGFVSVTDDDTQHVTTITPQ